MRLITPVCILTQFQSADELAISKRPRTSKSNTPTRSPSPSPSPSLDSPPFRTPIKSTNSLPGSSPLTPLSASPLKRTSTHPMDHASTPTKSRPPADALSELFDLTPKVPGRVSRDSVRSLQSKANKPVAKRMLGRTRSALLAAEPSVGTSLESMTSNSPDASASTLPHSPHHIPDLDALGSAVSQTPTISEEQFQSTLGPATAPLQRSNVRTYAGRSRSFLVELPTEGTPDGAIDADDLGLEIRESYKDLRMRWGVDDSEDDPRLAVSARSSPEPEPGRKGKGRAKDRPKVLLPPNMMNDLKSITELRSKGESRRFMDEVGYLFEGMDSSVGVSVRRGRWAPSYSLYLNLHT